MSLERCIPGLVAQGKLTQEQADDAMAVYGPLRERFRASMGDAAAEALASERTVAALEHKAVQSKRQKLLQVKVQQTAIADMAKFKGKDPGAAAVALFARDERAPYANIEYRHQAIRAQALAGLDQFLLRHSRNVVGELRDKAGLLDLVREAFGEQSGNASAAEFAKGWLKSAEWLRQRRNAAGGDTGKLADWGMPQSHDSLSVRQAAGTGATADEAFAAWRDFIGPMLDRGRMLDGDTGLPFSDAHFSQALRDVFDTISTNGWNKRNPGGQAGVGKLGNRRADHRFLIFKDADSWLQYQQRFGGAGTPFDVMMRHIDNMSREIAMMERLGPNPEATVRWLKDALDKRASLSPVQAVREAVASPKAQIDRIYRELTGANLAPENRAIAMRGATVRSWQTTTKLGSAAIAAAGDFANQTVTRLYNGLPVTNMLFGYLRQLNPASSTDRAMAIRSMLGAEDIARAIGDDTRFTMAQQGSEFVKRLAETTLKISGLDAVTRAGRYSFGMDALSTLTTESVKSFGQLDGRFAGMLERYGIGDAEWQAIRSTPLIEDRGAPWLKPDNIERADLRDRVIEMILSETDMAVPTPGLRTRAAVNGVFPRGNAFGEIARSAFQFKGFGVSMLAANWQRMMSNSTLQGRLAYAIGYTALLTLAGTYVFQAREIIKGNDPRPLDDWQLWSQGFFQGGAFGIIGDFINAAQNRFGGGAADTLAGPAWATLNQVGRVAIGDQAASLRGEKTNRGREAVKLLQQETPVIGSLWYTRLAYQRALQFWLQEQIDPQYGQSFQRMRQYAHRNGQDLWWQPGELQPDRAPNLANAVNGAVPAGRHR
ncbi:hypothetical protein [Sphingomonas oligoaromativorans]|uniref:hypothetical protein n=1 Tax=Sphingomonas oligoaromativorans TaxID=575322 RepID=UPI00141F4B9E|nr:hypothetical protein [Sphingomonas oligoaromativorans]NIJ34342.1 hypothetical protein [Sphingomonas oligoaromativorans]